MNDQPKPTGEWTGITLSRLIQERGYKGAADAHNSELAAGGVFAPSNGSADTLLLQSALKQIKALAAEWNANRLGGVQLQRQRWQKLGRIAEQALWKHNLPNTAALDASLAQWKEGK